MSVSGIDVSSFQPNIDWNKVRYSGIHFAFMKVNEGDFIDKSTTRERVHAAKLQGVLVGGYDFVRPRKGRTGAQEFDIFYKHAKAAGLLSPGCLRPVIDIEATGFSGPLKGFNTRKYVKSWIRQCVKRTGVHPIIYTAGWFWDDQMRGSKDTTQGCRLWVASYTSKFDNVTIPKGFDHASFWQFTDKASIPGIKGHVDKNTYRGTLASLRRAHTIR
jgi:GH25 family lysozyme M1 (1,4-beta-N-acetylmuramidase)